MRFGLVGCGGIGQIRAKAFEATPELRLVAVSDIDAGRAEAVARPTGAVVSQDWRALLRRDDIDAVILSTPPALHAEMACAALATGKHVLVEKPLARSPEECRTILAASSAARRFVATGFNYRFYPSGAIGPLDHIRAYSGYTAADHTHAWLHDLGAMGGGALRDNGIHLIDLTRWFLGEVEEVRGFRTNAVWQFRGCEDNGFALLRSEAGRVATLQASWTEWAGYRFRIELYGERGCITLSCFPSLVRLVSAEERGGAVKRRTHFFPRVQWMEKWKSYRWVVEQSFVAEHRAFVRAAAGEHTAIATGEDGLRTVEIAAATGDLVPRGIEA
jgi:predicted dehydrogenase